MTMATPDQGMLETASTSTVSKDYSRLDVDAILKGVEVVEGLQDGLPNQDGGDGTTVMDVSTKKMEEVSNKLRELMDESAPDSSYQAPDLAAANLKAMEKISIRGSHESLVDKLYQKAAQKQRQPDRIKPVAPANTGEKKLRPVKSFGNMPVVPAPSKNSRRQTALPNRGALRRTSSLSGLALKAAVGGLDALKEEEKRSKARKMRDPLSTSLHHGKASSSSLVSSSRTHKSEKSAGSSKSKRIIRKTASLPEEASAPDVPRSQSPRRNTVVSLSPTRKVRRSSSLDPKKMKEATGRKRESKDSLKSSRHEKSRDKKIVRKTSKGSDSDNSGEKKTIKATKRSPRKTQSGDDGLTRKDVSRRRPDRVKPLRRASSMDGDMMTKALASADEDEDRKSKALANAEIFQKSTSAIVSRMHKRRDNKTDSQRGRRTNRRGHKSDDVEEALPSIRKNSSDPSLLTKASAPRARSPRRATIQARNIGVGNTNDDNDDEEEMLPKRISDPSLISRVQRTRSPRRATMAGGAGNRGAAGKNRRMTQGVLASINGIPPKKTDTDGTDDDDDNEPKRVSNGHIRHRRRRHGSNPSLSSSNHKRETNQHTDDEDAPEDPRRRISSGRLRASKNGASGVRDRRRSTSHSPMGGRRSAETMRQASMRHMLVTNGDSGSDEEAAAAEDKGISARVKNVLGEALTVPTVEPLPPSVVAAFTKKHQSSRTGTGSGRHSAAALKERIKKSMEEKEGETANNGPAERNESVSHRSSSTLSTSMEGSKRSNRQSTVVVPFGQQVPKDAIKTKEVKKRNASFLAMPYQTGFSDLYDDDESVRNIEPNKKN